MKFKLKYILFICFLLSVSSLTHVAAVTDAELEALEKQIEQQEAEEIKQTEAEAKRRAEVEKLADEKRRLEEERDKLEDEKRELEKLRQTELKQKQQEEKAKSLAEEEHKRLEEEAANAKITVVFFRKSTFLGGGFQVSISNNGTSIGILPNGSFFIRTLPVGKHTFSTDKAFTSYGFSKSFEFNPGQTYYIQLLVGMEEGLEHVSQAEGREGIKKLKNTGNINPVDVLSDYDESEAYKEPAIQQAPL